MNIRKNDGFTLIELLVVIAIVGIVGTLIITFVKSSNDYYVGAEKTYERQSEARITMTYLTLRLRENDAVDGIDINTDGKGMKVKNSKGSPLNIFFEDGSLKEVQDGKKKSEAVKISNIESLKLTRNENEINIKVEYKNQYDTLLMLEQTITCRCALKGK